MNKYVKIVGYEDYQENGNYSKRLTIEFSQSVKRIENISLYNVEITETGNSEIVYLNEISNRLKNSAYSVGKHDFIFEFGKTLFNDGAEFSISFILSKNQNIKIYTFILENNQWKLKEDN